MKIRLKDLPALEFFSDNISKFVFWKDRNSVFLGCNKSFAEYAGLDTKEEIIGKTDFDLPWSKAETMLSRATDKRVMESGIAEIDFEEQKTLGEGEVRWLQTSKMPLHDNEGNIIGILGWFADITEKKKMRLKILNDAEKISEKNKELEKLNTALELTNLDLENFTYAASHDLQTPLIGIIGGMQLFEKKYADQIDSQFHNLLSEMIDSASRMRTLIKDILTYARTGSKDLLPESTDLNNVVDDKIKSLSHVVEKRKVSFSVRLPNQKIYCYPQLLGLVFYNLINNGIKFNDSEQPTITIDYTEDKDYWYFKISDNGIGIEEKNREKVFNPFRRLHSDRLYEGTGIGLSICKRIVNIHKGEIWITDNDENGSVFNFSILKDIQ